MKSKRPTYIQLDTNEDIPSIRDRLSFIRGQRVLLIWPEQGTALKRKIDLVLVQREARRRVIQLALVTHDAEVINHANELGISTFETISDAETSRWKRGRTKVFINRYHKPEDSPVPDDLMPVASRVRNPRKRLPLLARILVRVAVLSVVIGVIVGTVYLALPSATVTIALSQEAISVNTTIVADPTALDVDIENRVIPATRFTATVNTTQQIATTGSETGTLTRANGLVTFTNETSSTITLLAGTLVRTSTSAQVTFETTSLTIVPADGVAENVPIIATEEFAGTIGNVAVGAINTVVGEFTESLSVTNLLPTTGGTSPLSNIVTLEDQNRLIGSARQILQSNAYTEIQQDLAETQTIIIDTLNIPPELERDDWVTFSHDVGDETELLTLEMRAVVEALVIDDRFGQQIVFAQVSGNIPQGMSLNTDSFLYRREQVIEVDEENRATFQARGEGIASQQVDVIALQNQLAGQSPEDAARIIVSTIDVAPNFQPEISIQPAWFNRMPIIPIRIDLQIDGMP